VRGSGGVGGSVQENVGEAIWSLGNKLTRGVRLSAREGGEESNDSVLNRMGLGPFAVLG
jgi:hypothetical protein